MQLPRKEREDVKLDPSNLKWKKSKKEKTNKHVKVILME